MKLRKPPPPAPDRPSVRPSRSLRSFFFVPGIYPLPSRPILLSRHDRRRYHRSPARRRKEQNSRTQHIAVTSIPRHRRTRRIGPPTHRTFWADIFRAVAPTRRMSCFCNLPHSPYEGNTDSTLGSSFYFNLKIMQTIIARERNMLLYVSFFHFAN